MSIDARWESHMGPATQHANAAPLLALPCTRPQNGAAEMGCAHDGGMTFVIPHADAADAMGIVQCSIISTRRWTMPNAAAYKCPRPHLHASVSSRVLPQHPTLAQSRLLRDDIPSGSVVSPRRNCTAQDYIGAQVQHFAQRATPHMRPLLPNSRARRDKNQRSG